MGVIEDIVTPKKNYILRMWIFAGAVAVALFLFMLWHDRFRAECETDDAFYGLLGIEQYGNVQKSFSGNNFFVRAQKMGLGGNAPEEVRQKIAELAEDGAIVPADFPEDIPVLWLYARGRTKAVRDEGVRSRGEFFFDREKLCISVANEAGFSVQANPETFTVFHAKTGDAICAIPLCERPPRTKSGTEKFSLKIEFRAPGNSWRTLGEFPVEYKLRGSVPAGSVAELKPPAETAKKLSPQESGEAEEILNIAPEIAEIRSLSVPAECRFYSSELSEHSAFGEVELALKSAPGDGVPDRAWQVENVKISSGNLEFGYKCRDAFHSNVRFLYDDFFETRSGETLRVPIAKTLFPQVGNHDAKAWNVAARLIRTHSFQKGELHEFGTIKISKSTTNLFFAGTRVGVRAFMEKNYFRLLENGVPALVLEIAGDPTGTVFWQPFRVKTDKGEDLSVESVVIASPGIYQYWFMPTSVPATVSVTYAITKVLEISAEIVPEIRKNSVPADKKIP